MYLYITQNWAFFCVIYESNRRHLLVAVSIFSFEILQGACRECILGFASCHSTATALLRSFHLLEESEENLSYFCSLYWRWRRRRREGRTANIYRDVQGIDRDLWVQVFITGKAFDISRKSLLIWQGIPVKVRFPVDLTGNSCYIYS